MVELNRAAAAGWSALAHVVDVIDIIFITSGNLHIIIISEEFGFLLKLMLKAYYAAMFVET